jgi:prepilin-type N-terminal cleavage/methylation domain-containing protein
LKTLHTTRRSGAGFTLMELLISLAVSSMMFAAIMSAGTASMRSLAVADDYSYQSNEELRAMDYIARDLRRALTVTIAADGKSLSLTLPDYYSSYDSQGNPDGVPVTPTIANGAAVYGNADTPLLVAYEVVPVVDAGTGAELYRQLVRTQTIQSTAAVSTLVICTNVTNFSLAKVQLTTTVTYSITFDPRYQAVSDVLNAATTLSGTVAVRALRFQ